MLPSDLVLLSFLTTSMPHDAHTFNACDEMISGWQYSFMLKLALQPVSDQSPIGRQSVANLSPTSLQDFKTVKVFMKSVGDRSAIDQRLFGDMLATDR